MMKVSLINMIKDMNRLFKSEKKSQARLLPSEDPVTTLENNLYFALENQMKKQNFIPAQFFTDDNLSLTKKIEDISYNITAEFSIKNRLTLFLEDLKNHIKAYRGKGNNYKQQYQRFLNILYTTLKNNRQNCPIQEQKNNYRANWKPVFNISPKKENSLFKFGIIAAGILSVTGISAFFYLTILGCILTPIGVAIALVAGLCWLASNNQPEEIENQFEDEFKMIQYALDLHHPDFNISSDNQIEDKNNKFEEKSTAPDLYYQSHYLYEPFEAYQSPSLHY